MPVQSLQETLHANGAQFDGEASPLHFRDSAAEYAAACESAALFDLSIRSQIEMTGVDRAKFLHNFCTNDIKKLQPGMGCEAFVVNVKGRVLGHTFVFANSESLVIESVPGAQERLLPHLDRYIINEDVQLHDRTGEWGELYLCGPRASAILSESAPDIDSLPQNSHRDSTIAAVNVSIRRVDFTRQPGYLISAARESLGSVWETLRKAGAVPAGSEAFEPLRIEAMFPWYGRDITDDNLAQEVARTSKAISFTKGCYLGQEPIARIDALGHANRELRGLQFEADAIPKPGSKIFSPEGKEIGAMTSSARSYGTGRGVALGYVRVPFNRPGAIVSIATEDEARLNAEVFGGDEI